MGRINRRRDRLTKRLVEAVLRPFFRRPRMDLESIRAESPRRILVVRQHNQMGDMLCTTPALRAIHRAFPGSTLMLVTAPVNDGVVRNHPDLDAILLFDKRAVRRSPRAAWRFLRSLRAWRPDLAFVLATVSFSSTSAWIAVLSGARRIVGGSSEAFGWSFSRWLYNLEMPAGPGATGHAIDHALDALRAIGIDSDDRMPVLVPGPAAVAAAERFLDATGPGPWAVVHPGAGKPGNRWPAERFARAIEALETWGARVVLVEGPADGLATRETLEALGGERPVLRGVDLQTVAAVLGRAQVALVNDTGVMHVAGAMGTPAVAMFGPTPVREWAPPSPEMVSLASEDGTMEGLSLATVLEALRPRLDRGLALRP